MRRRVKRDVDEDLVSIKQEQLVLLEQQVALGNIDLFYGDETSISPLAYVPYGWQKKQENCFIPTSHGKQINCFGILSKTNQFFSKTTLENIDARFIIDFMDDFSLKIKKPTVIVLDNARIHIAQKVKDCFQHWQNRGLYFFFLPPYSPHLNIIERLWKEWKARWLIPDDYLSFDDLQYACFITLNNIGQHLKINFKNYS